ncbi:MAG TPA: MBL fold metallo-hydrolase [Ktedonobacteraceae bacterium]|nr:MBL fold metallo-hydrolase [Ktedonobacteraceae bacterium]
MRVTSLGSGSSGNALLVEAGPRGRTKLLVDAGLSSRILIERLRQAGTHPNQLQAVLITHEHIDHIIGLPVLMKRYAVPVITAPDTLAAIHRIFTTGTWPSDTNPTPVPTKDASTYLDWEPTESVGAPLASVLGVDAREAKILENGARGADEPTMPLQVGSRSVIGDIEVVSFPVSHDAIAPCGYLLTAGGCRICVAIDSGEVTPVMLEAMHHADLLVLESNHDRERLIRGPYPYHLKQRILSLTGHLSNDQAAEAVLRTWRTDSVRWLWLSHLSRTNNTPRLALKSMLANLEAANANLSQIHISVSPPGMGGTWDSTQLWHEPSLWEMQM